MNLYLQLQHNDGIYHPDPLHVILTTKLSLPYRLQYLHNAAEEGLGFLDVVLPSSVEVVEEQVEIDDEQSQETVAKTNEEHEYLIGQGSTVADIDDESDKMASSPNRLLHAQKNAQKIEIKSGYENLTITQDDSDNYGQDQHSNAREYYMEEVPMSVSIDSKTVEQVERRSNHTLSSTRNDTLHSGSTVEAHILHALSNEALHNGDVEYDGQEKEPQISSAASSTLRGDTSDVAHGEAQADNLTVNSQDERQSREASYGGNDRENLNSTVTVTPDGTLYLNSGSINHTAALNRRSNSPSIVVSQRKNSVCVSDIDNNEITYEDEDGDEDEKRDVGVNDDDDDDDADEEYGEADDNEDILTTGCKSVQDNKNLPATPLSHHGSLKRAREEDDGESSPKDDLQGMGAAREISFNHKANLYQAELKRVRSK